LFITSCISTVDDIDISDIAVEVSIHRFEQDLFVGQDEANILNLKNNYPVFFPIYVTNIIGMGGPDDQALSHYLNSFATDRQIREVFETCQTVFPKLERQEEEFTDAFKRFHYYFPSKPIPKVISFMSGFSYTIVVDDSLLGFGLDMYLGNDSEYYPRLGIPRYRFLNMDADHLVSDCMKAWIATEYELKKDEDDLLSQMIYHGKLLYALDRLLPRVADSIKVGHTAAQLTWCEENEADVWFHLIDRKLLYSKDNSMLTKYLNEGPFTPGFPEGSPGEIGKWIGWQIVRKYMRENPHITLVQLFEDEMSSQHILNASKYKPNK
jgi:gliding motility-associated lipoprotein GldB